MERISVGVVHESFPNRDLHGLVCQETSSHKGDMFTKRLDPNAFERALTLINLVRSDGSKYKAECAECVSGAAACSVSRNAHAPCAAPRAPPAMDMKFAVYFNFIVVFFKFALQELLNVGQLGRPRPLLFVWDFRLQGSSLKLWPCALFVIVFPWNSADVIHPCLMCDV